MSSPETKNPNFRFEIITSLKRLTELQNSKILWDQTNPTYQRSVYIETLILLKDLLQKAELLGHRLTKSDDVKKSDRPRINDVTDLISNFRDAACHIDTFRKYTDSKKAYSFIVLHGKQTFEHDPSLENKYEDDIAYLMGTQLLYLKRHIEKTFDDLKAFYSTYLNSQVFEFATT